MPRQLFEKFEANEKIIFKIPKQEHQSRKPLPLSSGYKRDTFGDESKAANDFPHTRTKNIKSTHACCDIMPAFQSQTKFYKCPNHQGAETDRGDKTVPDMPSLR